MFRVYEVTSRKTAIEERSKFQNTFHCKFFIVCHSRNKNVSFRTPRGIDSTAFEPYLNVAFCDLLKKEKQKEGKKKVGIKLGPQHK